MTAPFTPRRQRFPNDECARNSPNITHHAIAILSLFSSLVPRVDTSLFLFLPLSKRRCHHHHHHHHCMLLTLNNPRVHGSFRLPLILTTLMLPPPSLTALANCSRVGSIINNATFLAERNAASFPTSENAIYWPIVIIEGARSVLLNRWFGRNKSVGSGVRSGNSNVDDGANSRTIRQGCE